MQAEIGALKDAGRTDLPVWYEIKTMSENKAIIEEIYVAFNGRDYENILSHSRMGKQEDSSKLVVRWMHLSFQVVRLLLLLIRRVTIGAEP